MAVGKYVKNLGKSVGLAGIDVMKDLNPVITDTVQSNKEFVSEHYGKVKEFVRADDGLQNSEYYKSSKKLIKNALHELKTGEIYTNESKDRVMKDMAESFGIDMSSFDLDFSDLDDEEGKSLSKTKEDTESFFDSSNNTEISKDGSQVDINNNTTKTLNRMTTNNIVVPTGGGKATNKILSSSSKAMLQANMQNTSALLQGIHTISSFQNENTVKFYNDVSDKLAEIGNSLSNLSNMFNKNSNENTPAYNDDLEDLMLNGLKLDFYKRRITNSSPSNGGIGEIIETLKEYGLPVLQGVASNPLGGLMKYGIKSMLPKNFKKSLGRLNDSVSSLPVALQFLFSKWKGGSGIKKSIGELFGIDLGKTPELNFGKYNKSAISFDGVTKKAITNVIPSLLSKILSAVSENPLHKEELVYDYEKGKFTTKKSIRNHMQGLLEQESINDNLGDYKAKVLSQFKTDDLTENLQVEINNAFRKITEQALTPDSSLAKGTLSNDSRVETAIRQMYSGLSNTQHREFQKGLMNSISSRNGIYRDLINNESYHNAYDIDTNMINKAKKSKKELALKSQLEKLGLEVNKNGVLSKIFDLDDDNTYNVNAKKSPVTNFINKITDRLENTVFGDNEKRVTQYGKALDKNDNNLFNTDSTASMVKNGLNYGKRTDIQTGIVNVYSNKLGKGFSNELDGSHEDGLKRVPKDGYVAELHKDERVLTKDEARLYDKKEFSFKDTLKSTAEDIKTYAMVEKEKNGTTTMVISGRKAIDIINDKLFKPFKTSINNFVDKYMVEPFKKMADKGKNYFIDVISNPIREAFEPMKQRMKSWFGDKKSKLFEWGRNTFLDGKTWKETWDGYKTKTDRKIRSGVGKFTGLMNNSFGGHNISNATLINDNIINNVNKAKLKAEEMLSNTKTKATETAETVKNKYQETKDKMKNTLPGNGKKSEVNSTVSLTNDIENRIVKVDRNVEHIKTTLDDFFNAYLTTQGVQDTEMPNKRPRNGRFSKIKNRIRDRYNKFKDFYSNPFKGITDKFRGLKGITDIFKGGRNIKGPFKLIKKIMDFPNKIVGMVKNTLKTVDKITKKLGGFVTEQLPKLIEGTKKLATKMFDGAKTLMNSIGKKLNTALDIATTGVKTLYSDAKNIGKELWGTAKGAVSTVWDRFFGDGRNGKSGRKSKTMEVIVKGGHLDGIREDVNVTLRKKNNSYAETKAKMLAEDEENRLEREGNELIGRDGRERNSERISKYRDRMSKLMGNGIDMVKDGIKKSFIGQSYFKTKKNIGTKLAGNTMKGPVGSIGRMVGRGMTSPAQLAEAGITAVHVTGSDIPMGTDANSLVDTLTGGGGKGGIMGRMMSKFMDSKLGGKLFNTKLGTKALDLMTNGKGFLGNTKMLSSGLNAKLGGKLSTTLLSGTGKLGGTAVGKGMTRLAGKGGASLTQLLGRGATAGAGAMKGGALAGLGKAGSLLGKAGPLLGGLSKFAGPLGLALTAGKGIFDGAKGWKNAGDVFGTDDASLGQKLSSMSGSVLSGLSFGLLNSEKSSKFLHKAGTGITNLIPGVKLLRNHKERKKDKDTANMIKQKQGRQLAKDKLEEKNRMEVFTQGGSGQSYPESYGTKASAEKSSEENNIGGNIIPFISPSLLVGRNLIKVFRHNKKREDEAEKKLLQQMSPEEKDSYLASKSNSNILKSNLGGDPLTSILNGILGGGSKKSVKSMNKSLKKFGNATLGLLGITAAGGTEKVSQSGGFSGFWQKMKNSMSGKGWKTDKEVSSGGNGGSGSSSGGGNYQGDSNIAIKDISDIWKLSAKYEVSYNGDDTLASGKVSDGRGDYGGKSYGIPQFSLSRGSLQTFVNSLQTKKPEWYARLSKHALGSSGFDNEWQSIAKTDGTEFSNIQNEAIRDGYYIPFINNNKSLLDITKRGTALQSAIWSTSVQFGGGSSILKHALAGKNPASMSDTDIVRALYTEKRANNGMDWFPSSSADVRAGVVDRFHREEADLIALIGKEGDTQNSSTATPNSRMMKNDLSAHAEEKSSAISSYSRDMIESPMSRALSQGSSTNKSYSKVVNANSISNYSQRANKSNNNNNSLVSSSYNVRTDDERITRYTEMIGILNNIANNTGVTAQLLDKMFNLIDNKFKEDEKRFVETTNQQNVTRNNPFITGIDPDINSIATGI